MRKQIIAQFDLCTGCRICELACSMKHFGTYAPRKSHINVSIENEGLRVQPSICIQCENPLCMKACPKDAIFRDDILETIMISEEKCTGCKLCVPACPINAIYFNPKTSKATKCDLCGGDPVCTKYCPTYALKIVQVM